MTQIAALPVQDQPWPSAAPARTPAIRLHLLPWQAMASPDHIRRWDALALNASEPNPFFESWFLLPALQQFYPKNPVSLILFEVDGDLAGLMPLQRRTRYYQWPLPNMGNWLHANCFHGAPLVARGLERQFWQALLEWADSHARTALFLHLSTLPLSGALYDALIATLDAPRRDHALVHRQDRVMLQSDLSPDSYFEASISAKKRKELRRQYNRLSELGALQWVRSEDDTGIAAWIADFLELEASGWKGLGGSALASDPATAALFRASVIGAAQRGRLERLALLLDDRPIAMLATFIAPPGAFAFKTAFAEAYSAYSPGVLLQRENLAMLDRQDIAWSDSCADSDHPMIAHLWRERRAVGRISIAIGGPLRRALFRRLAALEMARNPSGVAL